jgi:3-hydroxy acid dehydrogenase / malonic semialdehyde reductase
MVASDLVETHAMSSTSILITGATSGIGEASALALEGLGKPLVIVGRRAQRLASLKARIKGECHVLELDLCDTVAIQQAIASLPPEFAQVEVLVNNAGLALGLEKAPTADLADWDTMLDTNVRALVHVTRHVLPGMVARNRGHIVNMGSVAGTYPYSGGNVYGATKAFVEQFSLHLRADLIGTRVRVTNIEPGMVATEFSEVRFKGDSEKAKAVYQGFEPLTAADIGDVVRYVVSLPERVNVNRLELMSVDQAFAGFSVHRK